MGGARKRKNRSKAAAHGHQALAKEREQETIRLINQAAETDTDGSQLRKLAAVRGLVNHDLRARLWLRLLGIQEAAVEALDAGQYAEWASGKHRDSSTVRVDVERSLWSYVSDGAREAKRMQLQQLLNAVVNRHRGSVYYYQGLHDVASVLLLVAGERAAFAILSRLATCHLRDCTRPELGPVMELLGLMYPILEASDPELAALAIKLGLPPFFALSWFLTWYAHDVADLGEVARLFDLFLASHPLMPLYVGAVAMTNHRTELLACEDMPSLHTQLTNLKVLELTSADDLACRAVQLYRQHPPARLAASRGMTLTSCAAPLAQLEGGTWTVPQRRYDPPPPARRRKPGPARTASRLQRAVASLVPGLPARRSAAFVTTAASVTGLVSLYLVTSLAAYALRLGNRP